MRTVRIIEGRSGAAGFVGSFGWARPVVCLVGCLVTVSSGCATGRFATSADPHDRRLIHRELGYSIAEPGWIGSPEWRSVDVDDADLAYGNADGAMISLSSNCPRSRATPAVLARHVTIGTDRREVHAAGPFEVAGAEGWSQTFDTLEEGVSLHVKAVTVVAGACVYDWLLVAADSTDFESIEPAFDGWIGTFQPPPGADATPEGSTR